VSTEQILALASVAVSVLTLFIRMTYNRGFDAGAKLTAEEVRARDELKRLKDEDPSADIEARKKEIDDELSKQWAHDGLSAKEVAQRLRRLHRATR
jgi:hypothetical protein